MRFKDSIEYIMLEIHQILEGVSEKKIKDIIKLFFEANNIFVYGAGRSGLVAKAFAIRLVHLGFPTFVVGETITRPVKKGDLVILVSGSGETIPVAMTAEIARRLGAKIISITSNPDSHIARFADIPVILKPKKKDASLAPLGTLFEISAWLFLDGLTAQLMAEKNEDEESMKERHATLE